MTLTTKELSQRTWPDYQRFFSQGNGWDHCACVHYQGVRKRGGSFAHERDVNLAIKCDLVDRGLAHGILVYDGKEPVGWCQFGPQSELPIRDKSSRKRDLLPVDPQDNVWRITCFCTLKEYREQGVTDVALKAVLQAIRRSGGGIAKAYPVVTLPNDPELDDLVRQHGDASKEVLARAKERFGATDVLVYDRKAFSVGGVYVHGCGPLWAFVRRGMTGLLHPGTVSMFDGQGFKATGILAAPSRKLPASRLVMERTLRRARTGDRRLRIGNDTSKPPSLMPVGSSSGMTTPGLRERYASGIECVHVATELLCLYTSLGFQQTQSTRAYRRGWSP